MVIRREVDERTSRHRLVINGQEGGWAIYSHPAFLEYDGQLYVSFTQYWSGPAEDSVFQLMRKRATAWKEVTAA